MKRAKTSVKVAIASALAISSTAAVIYAAPKIMEATTSGSSKEKVYLDVEKVDSDTVKVSLDNIEDIAKSLQFSIKLDDNVKLKKDENGKYLITDLISQEINTRLSNNSYLASNSVFTDYTYNEDSNTIDVLITSEDSLPKTENKIEIFTLDIEAKSDTTKGFNIAPVTDSYKYVSKDNKEYDNLAVDYDISLINLNVAPTIEYTGNVINLYDGEKLEFKDIKELIANDEDQNDTVTLEVRNITNVTDESKEDSEPVITEFSSENIGTYTFKVYAVDSMGEKSEAIKILVNVIYDLSLDAPTIEGVEDVEIQSGSLFKPLDGVSAKDAKDRELTVNVSGDLDLNPEQDTTYVLNYTAVDKYGKTTTETRKVTVIANQAPVIKGVDNTVINVGDEFNPKAGVEVDDDKDTDLISSLVVEGKVNTSTSGEYKLSYSVTDSGNKVGRAQRVVRVNRAPIVTGNDSTLVVKAGTEITQAMILGGINIIDETKYNVSVQIPTINGAGRYEAKIIVTDVDNGITTATRTVVVADSSIAELPNSGQGESQDDVKVMQVLDAAGIYTLNEKLSDATKEYTVDMTKKNFTEYAQYNFIISKKKAAFRNTDKIYLQVRVPNEIEASTGGIIITEYVEVLATEVTIDNKESLNHYISKGDEIDLTATIKPDNATNKELDWVSTNEDVLEVVRGESGVKVIAKEYGIATIKVGATDGSEKYDEFTFNVAHDFNELPEGVTVVGGDATEESPLAYETENIQSLNKLISNAKDEFRVLLQDKEALSENKVEYYLKLEEKGILSKVFGSTNSYYIALRLPNTSEFEDVLYNLEMNDTKAPTLLYNGEREITLENGAEFEVPVVTAKDNLDKNTTVKHVIKNSDDKVVNSIDTSVAGTYTITYSTSDASGNNADELVITVTVLEADTEAPKFEYTGEKIIVLDNGSDYEIPNITAIDDVDSIVEVSSVITKDGSIVDSIDTTIVGEYIITYTAVDSSGNESTLELKVIVKEVEIPEVPKDTEAPIFDYNGEVDVLLEYGAEYDIPVITAIDNVDGEVEGITTIRKDASNEIIKSIDTKVPGVYTITYEAVDKAGNKSDLVIKVTVKSRVIVDNIELGKGDGSIESPSEVIILESATVDNITKLLESIENKYNIEFIGQPQEINENIIYKIKLEEKVSSLRALFGKTGQVTYIEVKIPKSNVEVVKVLNDLYDSKIDVPETPGTSNTEVNNDKTYIPKTGGTNAIGLLGVGSVITALGGLLAYRRKKK